MTEPALRVQRLTVTFATDAGSARAVADVSFEVFPGEVLAVVGESGSGKSVSSRAAIGLLPPTARVAGTITVGTHEVTTMSERRLTGIRGREISMVFQEPGSALDPLFAIGFQIAEAVRAHTAMSKADARVKAVELLRRVGMPEPERRVDAYPHELSGGQKQRAVIAIAIACEPKVVIADEPTTALDVTVQAEILELLRELRDRTGCAIVLITHNMGVVADLADRVVVMKDGRVVEQAGVDQLFAAPAADYTKALLAAVPRLRQHDSTSADLPAEGRVPAKDDAVAIADLVGGTLAKDDAVAIADLVVEFGRFRAVDGVGLRVGKGEAVGLVGESGSGKSTIGRCVAGLQSVTAGSVRVLGVDIAGLRDRRLRPVRRRLGFVFQDPATSLNPRLTVRDCIAEPLVVHRVGTAGQRARQVREMVDAVALPAGVERRYPHELSGGQRQRVNLARALILRPELLIADEPTSALDVSVQATVLELFEQLQREFGFACLFISHDLAVVDRLCNRVVVLRAGRVVEQGHHLEVLRRPRADYTKQLLAAVLEPDPAQRRRIRAAE